MTRSPHLNCFFYYRGPTAGVTARARHIQVEDNTTKALVNTLQNSDPELTASFLSEIVGVDIGAEGAASYFLQGAPTDATAKARRLLAISQSDDVPPEVPVDPEAGSRPDASILVGDQALVVIEVKLDKSLTWNQLEAHAKWSGIAFPDDLRLVTWSQVGNWAIDQRAKAQPRSVTEFLLGEFIEYLELIDLMPSRSRGFTDEEFDFFSTHSEDAHTLLKVQLRALWKAVEDRLPTDLRRQLGKFRVGTLGTRDESAWVMTNDGETVVNFTAQVTVSDFRFSIDGWFDHQAQALLRWLDRGDLSVLSTLPDYELVCSRRFPANYAKRETARVAVWQKGSSIEESRLPASAVSARLPEVHQWIQAMDPKWEKPGFHLRKTWSRAAVIEAGPILAVDLAGEVEIMNPVVRSINGSIQTGRT